MSVTFSIPGAARALAACAFMAVAGAWNPVGLFNAVVPKDRDVEVIPDIAYGPDPRHRLDIYRPSAPPDGAVPVVVFSYGGSWAEGEKDHYQFVGRALAAHGYLTVIPDYRLVPDHPFPDFVEDVRMAVDWIGQNGARYGGDGSRLFLAGHSAGAYNVAMVALDPRFAPDPASGAGIAGVAALAGPFDFHPFEVDATREAFGHVPDPAATQPVNLVTPDAPPFLLIHGSGDDTVLPRNSIGLAERLAAAGVPVRLEIYDGVDHAGPLIALSRPLRWRNPALDHMLEFFADRLSARP